MQSRAHSSEETHPNENAPPVPHEAVAEEKSGSVSVDPRSQVVIPDGGARAWICIAGSFISLFASFGTVNAYGTFQDYYSSGRLSNYSESVISLNGAIQLFCLYGLAAPIGKVFDAYGTSILMPAGSFLMVFSLFMLSLCQPGQAYQ